MRKGLVEDLVHPRSGERLALLAFREHEDDVEEGVLSGGDDWFPILDGVPRVLAGELRGEWGEFAESHGLPSKGPATAPPAASGQARTNVTFHDKWARFTEYGHAPEHQAFLNEWYVKKLGLSSLAELERFYGGKRRILEVGPGSGFNTKFMADHTAGCVVAADLSATAAEATRRNTRSCRNCHVVQADLMSLPLRDESFDFIIADGVLHHTPDTRAAVEALYRKLVPGGEFFFYVYRQMGAARRFCDEYIRDHLTRLEPEACFAACEGITELGRELSRVGATVTLEKGVPLLGIPPGEHDVQRLLYYNFLKCFWNEAFDFATNNMVNFDWYHPHHAWQHTEEEVTGWLADLGVREYSFNPANPNGISVLLRKPS